MIKLYALMHEVDGQWKLAHRIKRTYSTYSSPTSHRALVFDTYRKAELALRKTSSGNYLPEGTEIIEMTGENSKNNGKAVGNEQ